MAENKISNKKGFHYGWVIVFVGFLSMWFITCIFSSAAGMMVNPVTEEMGISRQGVRDLIKKAEEELFFYEEKLGLAKKFESAQKHAEKALALCENNSDTREIENEIRLLLETVG